MQVDKNVLNPLALIITGVLIGGMAVYFSRLGAFQTAGPIDENFATGAVCDLMTSGQTGINNEIPAPAAAYLKFREIKKSFIPLGVPNVYGRELDISFDEVQEAIDKVRVFGPTYGQAEKKIILTGADLERYKKIGASISCRYCCGVKTLTKEDGSAACGCAHSIMMRGLAAYLIKNHPEISNEEILEELNQWLKTYFPKQTLSAKLKELEESGEAGIKEILEEFPDFLPQMVGGC